MDIFNNREIAIGIWIVALLVLCIINSQIRGSLLSLLKCFTQKAIIISLTLMILYVSLMLYGLYKIDLWSFAQLKNTIIWTLVVGCVSLLEVSKIAENPKKYFQSTIKDTFRLVAVLEFIIAFYVFPLWAELLILSQTIAEREERHASVNNFLNGLLMWLGICLVFYAGFNLVSDFDSFAKAKTLSDFSLPPILTLLYMPFLFIFAVYANYESLFIKLQFSIKDPVLKVYAKRRTLLAFHFRTILSKRLVRDLTIKRPNNKAEIEEAINKVKELWLREKAPPSVSFEKGWSPYAANNFLVPEGLVISDYHCMYNDKWGAGPEYLKLGDTILDNSISYYIEGNETTCTLIELRLKIEEDDKSNDDKRKFISFVKILFSKALSNEMQKELENHIFEEQEKSIYLHNKEVIISVERWQNSYNNSYEIKFAIQNQGYQKG